MGVHFKAEVFPLTVKRARELVSACFLLGLCPVSGEFFRVLPTDCGSAPEPGDCAHVVSMKAFLGSREARDLLVAAVRECGPFFLRPEEMRSQEGAFGLLGRGGAVLQ